MTTAKEVMSGPLADQVRATWRPFRDHAAACATCNGTLWRLLKDPGVIDRHAEYRNLCTEGAELWGKWDVAVTQLVDFLNRRHQRQRHLVTT